MIEANPEYDWNATLRSDILIETVHFITNVRPMSASGVNQLWRRFLAPCFRFYMAQWATAVSKRAAFMRTSQFTDNLRQWLTSMSPVHRVAWNAYYKKHHGPLRLKVTPPLTRIFYISTSRHSEGPPPPLLLSLSLFWARVCLSGNLLHARNYITFAFSGLV
jgi:hypothetical protein